MPEPPAGNDTISVYRAAATWLVGLSAAAVGGAFLDFDKVASAPLYVRLAYFLTAVIFGFSIVFGIEHFYWLNYAGNQRERRMQIDAVLSDQNATAEDKEKARKAREQVIKNIDGAWTEIASWYKRTRGTFTAGMIGAALVLLLGVLEGSPPKADSGGIQNVITNPAPNLDAPFYEIVNSAVHATRHGREAHTFLLDKKSGVAWQMKCKKGSDDVEFHRVHRLDFNGQPDDPAPTSGHP